METTIKHFMMQCEPMHRLDVHELIFPLDVLQVLLLSQTDDEIAALAIRDGKLIIMPEPTGENWNKYMLTWDVSEQVSAVRQTTIVVTRVELSPNNPIAVGGSEEISTE